MLDGNRYDLSLRFRTTLPNGLLAVGQGQTFYRLELSNGQLNLHSSLLNKWEGVFLGNNLNDAEWQTIRVRFNLTHLHLVVNQQVDPFIPIIGVVGIEMLRPPGRMVFTRFGLNF